jgi:hypothetical protein
LQISKKIAIIELQAHAEVFFHFAKLLNGTVDLLLLTTADIYQDAPLELTKNTQNQWMIIQEKQSDTAFLCDNLAALNTCQSTLFVTIVRDFRFYANLKLDAKKILIIHNSLAMLQPIQAIHITFSWSIDFLLDLLRVLKCFLLLEFWYKKKLVKHSDLLVFPTAIIEKYVKSRIGYLRKLKTASVEFSFYEPNLTKQAIKSIEEIIITIPGTISNEGRDYEMVIKALKKVIPILEMPIQVILAGRPKGDNGQEIIEKVETLQTDFFLTLVFKNSIPQREYEAILAKTDFLVLPLKKQVKYGIYQEINGLSKITGSINDQIRYGLPALISSDYPLPIELENVSQRFKNADDLSTILENWIKNRPFDRLEKERQVLQKKYAKAEVKNALLAILK